MRRGRILILLGLILAIGAAAVVFLLLQSATQTAGTVEVPRETVVVAKQPIAEDEPLADRLELRDVPSEMVQEGALRTLDGTETMLAKGPIPQGSIVYQEMIQTPEEQMREGNVSQLVEPGYVAMAFPIDELSSVSYGIQPGDYVDVLMTLPIIDIDQENQVKEPVCPPLCPSGSAEGDMVESQATEQKQRLVTQLTVQKIRVLGVGRWNYTPAPTEEAAQTDARTEAPAEPVLPEYITLMLQPQDALVLKMAKEYGVRIDMAVRAADDGQDFATQAVTLDYLLARFGIDLPPKQPYTIEGLVIPEQLLVP
jgi:Flp pilus assembly protein CpaB